jgi:hypothetical protein
MKKSRIDSCSLSLSRPVINYMKAHTTNFYVIANEFMKIASEPQQEGISTSGHNIISNPCFGAGCTIAWSKLQSRRSDN